MTKKAINLSGDLVDVALSTPTKLVNGQRYVMSQHEIDALSDTELVIQASSMEAYKKTYRIKRENQGVTYQDKVIQTDLQSRTNMVGVYTFAKTTPEFTTNWRAADNTWLALNNSQIIQLGELMLSHIQKCFMAHKAIEGITYKSKADLETAYDAEYNNL